MKQLRVLHESNLKYSNQREGSRRIEQCERTPEKLFQMRRCLIVPAIQIAPLPQPLQHPIISPAVEITSVEMRSQWRSSNKFDQIIDKV